MTASTFTLAAGPDTDIWKKPPAHDVFTAPHKPLSSGPLNSFVSATITFTGTYVQQFDQAGLLLVLTKPASPSTPRRWIKTGVELFDGECRVGTVCCDRWADWSIASPAGVAARDIQTGRRPVTVRVESVAGADGRGWWIYQVVAGEKVPLREVAWVYGDDGGDGWELEVCAAVARPGKELQGELEATFEGFDAQWQT